MKYLEKNIDFKISQFDLSLTPTQITFHNTQAQSYVLQLCKGPQIYKQFAEHIWVHAAENTHRFADGQSATFKLQNQKQLSCDWSLYKVTDDDLRDFIGTVNMDVSRAYETYVENMKKLGKEYTRLISNQQLGQQIAKQWLKIKEQITHQYQLQGKNREMKVDLRCKLAFKCEVDRLVEEEIKKITEKKLAKTLSKNSVSFSSKKSLQDESISPQHLEPQYTTAQDYCAQSHQDQISQIKIIKHEPVSKKETLSDIQQVSVSNEYSSNFGGKASKRPEGMSINEVNQIPEEYEPSSPFRTSTRTQNYDKLDIKYDIDNLLKNRSSTSDQNITRENEPKGFTKTANSIHNALREHFGNQLGQHQLLGKSDLEQGIQTAPQSLLKPQEQQTQHLPLNSNIQQPKTQHKSVSFCSFKVVCILLVLIVLALGSFYQLTGLSNQAQVLKIEKPKTAKKQEKTKKQQPPKKKEQKGNKNKQANKVQTQKKTTQQKSLKKGQQKRTKASVKAAQPVQEKSQTKLKTKK